MARPSNGGRHDFRRCDTHRAGQPGRSRLAPRAGVLRAPVPTPASDDQEQSALPVGPCLLTSAVRESALARVALSRLVRCGSLPGAAEDACILCDTGSVVSRLGDRLTGTLTAPAVGPIPTSPRLLASCCLGRSAGARATATRCHANQLRESARARQTGKRKRRRAPAHGGASSPSQDSLPRE
jgi:hypothetical protein